jgi:hypothetical protein
MSNAQDTRDNTEAIRELSEKVAKLTTKCEILNERLSTIQKLVYGVIGLILTAVVTALTRGLQL